MWDILEVTHEGTTDVKRARKHALIQQYEMFRMLKGETISDVQKRFTHIVNHLISFGKIFEKEELKIKILKCLDRSWQLKVTAIFESKDLTTLTTTSLLENEEKHGRSISLRATSHKDGYESSECSDGETLNLLTRKFGKFLKKNNKDKNQPSNKYNSKNVNEFNSINYTCFGCGKQGHIKAECPSNVRKEKRGYKKHEKKGKSRKAYKDNSSSSSSSKEDEEVNVFDGKGRILIEQCKSKHFY
ncbi:uncharacterized protein [Phaseolus vulgaris]|uniref:uncharacterized protein n=1 Tax=Phaseolus vulgaris TaxID=3885 RepID=UPI0035CBCE5E